jgi:hypothetical protein
MSREHAALVLAAADVVAGERGKKQRSWRRSKKN